MKNIGVLLLLILIISVFGGCKKENSTNSANIISKPSILSDTIAYKMFSPPKYIASTGSGNYLIDLDFDGVPDAKMQSNYSTGAWNTNVDCGCYTFVLTTNIIFDTIFHSPFIPLLNKKNRSGESYYFSDTISPSNSNVVYTGDTISQSTTQCVGPPPYFLQNSGGFLGFVKSGSVGSKYGWVEFHFDSVANLYIDGIALNNKLNAPIIAGSY